MSDEYIELFGEDENCQKSDENVCNHTNIENFKKGGGYCKDCGLSFRKEMIISKKVCKHKRKYEDNNGLYVCSDCNTEIEIQDSKPEWKHYPNAKNPARCHFRTQEGSVVKVFEDLGIEVKPSIIAQTDQKYNIVMEGKTARGKHRKSVIAACLLYSYREFGEFRTSDYIRDLFKIPRKKISKGLDMYYQKFPSASKNFTTPEDLLSWVLTLTGVHKEHYEKIVKICQYLENSSMLLKRSSPQSVASSIVNFYLYMIPGYREKLGLSKSEFAKRALLSEITITKLTKEISKVSGYKIDI